MEWIRKDRITEPVRLTGHCTNKTAETVEEFRSVLYHDSNADGTNISIIDWF
jgi:hypothetical protein